MIYDGRNLYIAATCYEPWSGSRGIVVNDLSRDFELRDDDVFEVIIDTFDDDQNGFLFATNPCGAKFDAQVTNDGSSFNEDWDTVWHVATAITEEGWQVEMALPFKSLRFRRVDEQVWGINFMRCIRRKAEEVYWSPIPRPFRLTRVSLAGSLRGVRNVQQGRNLYIKPYLMAPWSRLREDDVDFKPDAGFDVKWGLTSQLTLDLTVNTDFSQVEADEEQINLTRFRLFFPEKRDFFLENAGFFAFGQGVGTSRRGLRGPDLVPFFSRRIGIRDGVLAPILGGARLTGRAGAYTLGLLSLQTDEFQDEPSTNFSVVRVRRDVLHNSNIGVLFINKEEGDHFNRTYGVDGNFSLFRRLSLTTFLLKTRTPGKSGEDGAGKFELSWQDPFWRMEAGFLSIEDNFNPEVGFVRRHGIRKSSGDFGFAFRPEDRIPWIREIQPSFEPEYITDQENRLLTRELEAQLRVQFQDSSRLFLTHSRIFERLDEPFQIREAQSIPSGDYGFRETRISYRSDESRMLSGELEFSTGGFFHGSRDAYEVEFRLQPNYRLRTGLMWQHNDIGLPDEDFSTDVLGTRIQYSFSTSLFVNALIQYNSDDREISSNIRFHWIHRPRSDFFVVYNERRLTAHGVRDRALILKYTRLFDF